MSDNGGWLKKLLMWDWHELSHNGYPGWESSSASSASSAVPWFVKLTHVAGSGESSHELASAWDDVAEVAFYQRDWSDGSLSVRKGDGYTSGWWFQTRAERDRFVAWSTARHS